MLQQIRNKVGGKGPERLGATARKRKQRKPRWKDSEAYNRLAFLITMRLAKAGVVNAPAEAKRILDDAQGTNKAIGTLVRQAIADKDKVPPAITRQRQPRSRGSVRRLNIRRTAERLQRAGMGEKQATELAAKLVAQSSSLATLRENTRLAIDSTSKRNATAEATPGTAKQPQTAD